MSSSKKCIVPTIVQDTSPSRTVSFNELTGGKERVRMSLSVEELALLNEIQRRGRINSSTNVRTGKISVSELMGCGDKNADKKKRKKDRNGSVMTAESNKDLHNLLPSIIETTNHAISVDPATLLDVAGWKIPPLPPGLVSITHEADRHPYPSALPTCIFEKAMKAAAIVHAGSQLSPLSTRHNTAGSGNGVAANGNTTQLAPLDLIRLLPPLSPMYPLISDGMQRPATPTALGHGISAHGLGPQRQVNKNGGFGAAGHHQYFNNLHCMQGNAQQGNGSNQQRNIQQNQKTRKPFFMPYMSLDAVNRGIANGDLIKGILRVNQRNYEESFVDNPMGDEQQDILILGVHDRNRALHGDVVVVRIKDRNCWVVRDALYEAWRGGNLKASVDDNGKPLTIPPIKRNDYEVELSPAELLDLPACVGKCISSGKMKEDVPVTSNRRYSREQMLCIAAKLELERRKRVTDDNGGIDPLILNTISKLAIIKRTDSSTGLSQSGTSACGTSVSSLGISTVTTRRNGTGTNGSVQRRSNYRILSDMPDEDWGIPDMCLQKTAEVVFISEQKHCRAAVGMLKMMADGNRNWALFSPGDSRMPRMMIPAEQTPAAFFDRPQDFAKFIYVARMVEWQATAQFARGKLYKSLGLAGDIEAETEGLLLANDVDTREFSQAALSSLPITEAVEWKIDEKEFKYRKDFRDETVFTIDPVTARDLDDALHIKPIANCDGAGNPGWEVGVHIADVSHFVQFGTELDHWAFNRGTSVYLVHKVIPMLPQMLCEELCSLNPDVDRLTFSVVWKINDQGEIFDEWFGRTIIRSCCKLSYEHAQDFIVHPEKDFVSSELPKIFNGKKSDEVKEAVLRLNKIAVILRKKRFENGSINFEMPKLNFTLDETSGMPNGLCLSERKEANFLVEEFMLLANMAVARKIELSFPKTALLRRHPPPKIKMLRDILEKCEKVGFEIDGSSSATIASSLLKYEGNNELKRTVVQMLTYLLMKSMQLALYFCVGSLKNRADYAHYALSVPFYTHFTSPIRRYPDIMVHRFLSAALGYSPAPGLTVKEVETIASHCNDRKLIAKTVSEASDDMFFGVFIKECGPLTERAVVIQVLDASFDVLVMKYGVVKRVYTSRLRLAREPRFIEGPCPSLLLYWDSTSDGSNAAIEQVISMCTVVEVILSALPEPTKYQAVLKQPVSGEKLLSLAEAITSLN
uniref:DIS3-like exonuclease 2 n=1 Tax=Brugia malayi TaxID=6279 RepID=A0A0I9N441_BRUMA|nr:BMA-DISL-2 [Brugia malayi]